MWLRLKVIQREDDGRVCVGDERERERESHNPGSIQEKAPQITCSMLARLSKCTGKRTPRIDTLLLPTLPCPTQFSQTVLEPQAQSH